MTSVGNNLQVQVLSIPSTSDVQIGFNQAVNSVTIQCRTGTDLQLRTSPSSSDFFTIKSGTTFTLNIQSRVNLDATYDMPLWLRSGTGTVNAEIIGTFGN